MYRKVKKISIVLSALVLASCTCNRSFFQILTHNNVGYWTEEGCIRIRSYSKKDSTFKEYNDNMEEFQDQWLDLRLAEHKFHIFNDTLFTYHRIKGTEKYIRDYTDFIVSAKKNRIKVIEQPLKTEKNDSTISNEPDTTTWVRVKKRDRKRLR